MRLFLLASAAVLTATSASADTWSAAYDGTILSTYSDGHVVKVYVNADHSYSIALPNGGVLKGTWADSGDQSCFTITDPPPKPGTSAQPVCLPVKEYKVGDSFQGEDPTGKFTGVIQAGR